MFYNCSNLTTLDLSNWDTSNVTIMWNMFSNCTNLTQLDVSNFDTSSVTNMQTMFNGCSNLTILDVSNFNTSKVTDMSGIFRSCNNLTIIGLIYANIDTINKLPTPSISTLYINTNIDQTAYTGSSKLEAYEQRTVTINIPTALRSNEEIADRMYWNDEDKHYYIEQNINPNTNETLETPNIIASGIKQPIYLKIYEDMLSVGISNIDASYMSINVPFFEIPTDYEYKWEDELDYIKQSFELRFPDEDDVPEGWGFMGLSKMKYYIDNSFSPVRVITCHIEYKEGIVISTSNTYNLSLYDSDNKWLRNITALKDSYTLPSSDASYFAFSVVMSSDIMPAIIIDGKEFVDFEEATSNEINSTTYTLKDIKRFGTGDEGLKTLIDWVDNCKDEEFVRDFDQHFNRDYTLRYFLLVITLGMVDNLG